MRIFHGVQQSTIPRPRHNSAVIIRLQSFLILWSSPSLTTCHGFRVLSYTNGSSRCQKKLVRRAAKPLRLSSTTVALLFLACQPHLFLLRTSSSLLFQGWFLRSPEPLLRSNMLQLYCGVYRSRWSSCKNGWSICIASLSSPRPMVFPLAQTARLDICHPF
jgi:hypothetical protein